MDGRGKRVGSDTGEVCGDRRRRTATPLLDPLPVVLDLPHGHALLAVHAGKFTQPGRELSLRRRISVPAGLGPKPADRRRSVGVLRLQADEVTLRLHLSTRLGDPATDVIAIGRASGRARVRLYV